MATWIRTTLETSSASFVPNGTHILGGIPTCDVSSLVRHGGR